MIFVGDINQQGYQKFQRLNKIMQNHLEGCTTWSRMRINEEYFQRFTEYLPEALALCFEGKRSFPLKRWPNGALITVHKSQSLEPQ